MRAPDWRVAERSTGQGSAAIDQVLIRMDAIGVAIRQRRGRFSDTCPIGSVRGSTR